MIASKTRFDRPMASGGGHALIGAVAGFALALTSVAAVADDGRPDRPIAYTAGQIDIKAAKLALEKSKNKEVRDFAENMVRDHAAVNDQAPGIG